MYHERSIRAPQLATDAKVRKSTRCSISATAAHGTSSACVTWWLGRCGGRFGGAAGGVGGGEGESAADLQ